MKIEINVAKNINEPKIIIHTDKMTEEITEIYDRLNGEINKKIKAFKDDKMYLLNEKDVESIYAEDGNTAYVSRRYIKKIKEFLNS